MPSREQLLQIIDIQTEVAKLGLDLGGVMQFIVEQTLSLINAYGAVIELAENDEMVYRAASGSVKSQLGLRLKISSSISGLSVTTGETLVCVDSEIDDRVDREACRKVGLRSMIVIPLLHLDERIGALKAISIKPNAFSAADIQVLTLLSDVVAAAIYFSVKYERDDLYFKATHDDMTGLANKALFMERLRNTVSYSSRYHKLSGVLMIDMDRLKHTNDSYGHRVGDAVLIEFAHRLQQVVRASDTVARLGGDEFGVILTPVENTEGIEAFIQRIHERLAVPFVFEDMHYSLAASIGYAVIPQGGIEPDKILALADQRMYAVKKSHHQRDNQLIVR